MIAISTDQRENVFKVSHPAYAANLTSWTIFLDAYDGQGGFLDGSYLDRYPREEEGEYKKRMAAARYHNYTETLVDLYVRKIFAKPVERTAKNEELTAWFDDVDGNGTAISDFIRQVLTKALASGHAGVLCDKTQAAPTGPSKADEKAQVYLTQYLPPAIQDWRQNADRSLAGVKLREAVPNVDLLSEHAKADEAVQMLLWDGESWARVPADKDQPIVSNTHNLGLVPFAVLAPKPSQKWPLVGKSLLGNANILRAMFNRAAEEDQVLRDQAFSMLTIDVPQDGDVEAVKAQLGSETGTTRALVTKGSAKYISADQGVPEAIRKNIAYLVQEIYRMAHMRFQRDSLEAESAEAIRLKFDELNDTLIGIAAACAALEKQIVRFWCGWKSTDTAAADAMFEALELNINYAEAFFLGDLEQDLKAWVMAIKAELGATMEARIKLKMAHRIEPDLDEDSKKKVESEIKAIVAKPKPDVVGISDQLRANATGRLAKFAGQQPPPAEGAAA